MIILSKNFFNVAKTAILDLKWKGSEAKNVHLALKELDRLEEYNRDQKYAVANQQEADPEAGDIEYDADDIHVEDDKIPDEIMPEKNENS